MAQAFEDPQSFTLSRVASTSKRATMAPLRSMNFLQCRRTVTIPSFGMFALNRSFRWLAGGASL